MALAGYSPYAFSHSPLPFTRQDSITTQGLSPTGSALLGTLGVPETYSTQPAVAAPAPRGGAGVPVGVPPDASLHLRLLERDGAAKGGVACSEETEESQGLHSIDTPSQGVPVVCSRKLRRALDHR